MDETEDIPLPDTLTPKQARFCQLIVEGRSQTDAYKESYNTNANARSVRVLASRLAKEPKIAARILALKGGELPLTEGEADKKVTERWVLERLRDEAANTKNPPSARVRALELLGKKLKMFDENTTVTVNNRSADEIEREIHTRLAALLGQPKES